MGAALEHISGHIANLGVLTNLTMNTGDSLTTRACPMEKGIWLLSAWATVLAAGVTEIHSPRMHDNVHGLRLQVPISLALPLISPARPTRLFTVDTLTVQLAGGVAPGTIQPESLLLYYEDVGGVSARFITPDDLDKRIVHLFAQEVTVVCAVNGDYSAAVATNANFDFMKANTDYALVGYLPDINIQSVHWRGPDFGNLRIAGPGCNCEPQMMSEWFIRLSRQTKFPLIPVMNSNNKAGTFVDALADNAGGTLHLSQIFAELKPL